MMEQIPSYRKCENCNLYVAKKDVKKFTSESVKYQGFNYENGNLCCPKCGGGTNGIKIPLKPTNKKPDEKFKFNLTNNVIPEETLEIMFESRTRTI